MEIKLHVEVPPQLVQLIVKHCTEIPTIKQVIIGAEIDPKLMHGRMGVFVGQTGSMIIDIAQCVKNTQWFQYGVFFLWNTWLNMVWAVLHEAAHAVQVELMEAEHLDDDGWDVDDYEREATETALEVMVDYLDRNPLLPNFKEFGWAKGPLQKCLNALYPAHKALFNEEFSCLGSPAAANAVIAAKTSGHFNGVDNIVRLVNRINDRKEVGVVVNNIPFLKASEIISLTELGPED